MWIIEVKEWFFFYFNNIVTHSRALSSLKVLEGVENIFKKCLSFELPNNNSEFEYKIVDYTTTILYLQSMEISQFTHHRYSPDLITCGHFKTFLYCERDSFYAVQAAVFALPHIIYFGFYVESFY